MNDLQTITDRTIQVALCALHRSNDLSREHTMLVTRIAQTLVDLAFGKLKGRYAVEAPVGAGKSSLIQALIGALSETTGHTGVLVLNERVDAGADAVKELVELHGLDRNTLAHVHSEAGADTKEDAADRPFVYATHSRAQYASILPLLTYRGQPRAVLIDEALYSSSAIGLRLQRLTSDIAWAENYFAAESGSVERELVAWLGTLKQQIADELAALEASGKRDSHLTLTAPDPDLRSRFQHRLESAGGEIKALHPLLTAANMDERFRLLLVGDESAAILQHKRVLPAEMENVVIMDAGAGVDKLLALDDGIQLAHKVLPHFAGVRNPASVKSWSAVEIHRMQAPGGRSTMRDEYRAGYADAWAPMAVAEFVRDKCPEVGVILLVTYKSPTGQNYEAVQRAALVKAGVKNPERCVFTWWGRHTATNDYRDAVAVICCGVLQLDRAHVTAWALGQIGRDDADVPEARAVTDIMESMTAIRVYQAAGRGAARSMNAGKTPPMVLAYIHQGAAAAKYVRGLMPGAREIDWPRPQGSLNRRQKEGLTTRVADAVKRELGLSARAGVFEVPTKSLREKLGRGDVTSKVLSDAVTLALKDRAIPWTRTRQTLTHLFPES